jgi:hypothetical protein
MKKTPIRDYNQQKRDYLDAEKKKRDDAAVPAAKKKDT